MNAPEHKSYGNLSFEERSALKDLKSNVNLVIREADKGCSVVVMDRQRYIEEGYRELNDTSVYLRTHASAISDIEEDIQHPLQIGAGLYAVGRPVRKRNDEDGQIGTIQSLPLERGALFNRFFGEPAHGTPHVAGGASGPIGGCRDESRTDNPDLDLRHVFDRNNRKTDLI